MDLDNESLNILFVPQGGMHPSAEEIEYFKSIVQSFREKAHYYFLTRDFAAGISAYHGNEALGSEPFMEIENLSMGGKEITPESFVDIINDQRISLFFFFEPELSILKLVPLVKHYKKQIAVIDRRTLFTACPLGDLDQARFRTNAYALSDLLFTNDEVALATWQCAGFTNVSLLPNSSEEWVPIIDRLRHKKPEAQALQRILISDMAYDVWEKELPFLRREKLVPYEVQVIKEVEVEKEIIREVEVIREVEKEIVREIEIIREVDITEPWQKALGKIVNRMLPRGTLRRKFMGCTGRHAWRSLKFIRRLLFKTEQ